MSLGLAMHAKWDGISMAAPPMHSYKHERPAYSTPQPVEITPTNNECRLVELRGAKVASFILGGEEYICLPQAFDLFLKHLVGGLHTVYTKLKRLNITPVVCNVEQVRVLRGLGAIQPGVNRCKLITRKDFEILHQDCTQASRPGRPPKRYPMLPPTTDLASHYPAMRSMAAAAHGMLGATDLSALHKRMRLDQDAESAHIHQRERRLSGSPQRDGPTLSSNDLSNDMHANATNMYLQQAIRQAAATGIHNSGLDAQQAMAATGMNPAALMMMSHPALFSSAFPPAMLNHMNQIAQNRGASNSVTSAAAAAAAQIAVNGGSMHQQAAAAYQVAAQASLAANLSPHSAHRDRSFSLQDEKTLGEGQESPKRFSDSDQVPEPTGNSNGGGSEGCNSPRSSLSSSPLHGENHSIGSASAHSDSGNSAISPTETSGAVAETPIKDDIRAHSAEGRNEERTPLLPDEAVEVEHGNSSSGRNFLSEDVAAELAGPANGSGISSMQTLLTNIQGLLKVAADNARLQEKHSSFELADLKSRMTLERQKRDEAEKKLEESEKIRALVQRRLKKERKVREILQEQLDSMKQQLGRDEGDPITEKIPAVASVPITGVFASGRRTTGSVSPVAAASLKRQSPVSNVSLANSPSTAENCAASSLSGQGALLMTSPSLMTSSTDSRECGQFSFAAAAGNNSNSKTVFVGDGADNMAASAHFDEDRKPSRDHDSVDASPRNGRREVTDRVSGVSGSHAFFNAGQFQTAATQ